MNRSMRNQVQHWELLAFVGIELSLSYYTCTPGRFFDVENERMFPVVRHATISQNRYFQMLAALGAPPSQTSGCCLSTWVAPLDHARDIAGGMQLARGVCSAIGYVERLSILSLDDDLLRLRSSLIDAYGLAATNNPKKGLGVTQHGIVSLCTNLFCCGHVGSRGESVIEVVQLLLLSLTGKSVLSHASIHNLLAFDRGYGGTAGEVMSAAIEMGCDLNGTAKKINSFPFTFGKAPARGQVAVEEEGSRCIQWKQKRDKILQTAGKTHYAMAFRTGLGRVVLGHTTLPMCAPGHWEFVTRGNKGRNDIAPPPEVNALLLSFETDNVVQKTEGQRSPEWFLFRFGTVTGTAAYSVFNSLARQMVKVDYIFLNGDNLFQNVFRAIGINYTPGVVEAGEENEPLEAYRDQRYTRDELMAMKNNILKDICKAKSLTRVGKKVELVERILASVADVAMTNVPTQEVLMGCWFMTPVKSVQMKLGSKNESNILKAFPVFLEKHSNGIKLVKLKEYGLLTLRGHPEAAFSPDGIGCFTSELRGQFVAGCEWKTMTVKTSTEASEHLLVHKHGKFAVVNAIEDPGEFKELVPQRQYRGQLIHNMCCSGLNDWFYVTASLTSILRVVQVQVTDEFRYDYRGCMRIIKERYMGCIYGNEPLPANCVVGHCKDEQTFVSTLKLWKAMNKLVEERGRPLPRGRHILPSLVALWNRIKGGVDVYSRMLKNCKAVHHCLAPGAAIWLRMLQTMIYNGHQSYLLLQSYDYLMNVEECKSFQQYMFHKNTHKTYADYCRDGIYGIGGLAQSSAGAAGAAVRANNEEVVCIDVEDREHKKLRYNLRQAYFNDDILVSKRLSKTPVHHPSRLDDTGKTQRTCVWCCQKTHGTSEPSHSRFGYKTRMCCALCGNVPLCTVKRINGESCFDMWHSASTLYNPCACDVSSPLVRAHANRSAPPSRRRNKDDQPNQRSLANVVTVPRPRRSERQTNTPNNLFPDA
jgi:hypothetical protein